MIPHTFVEIYQKINRKDFSWYILGGGPYRVKGAMFLNIILNECSFFVDNVFVYF